MEEAEQRELALEIYIGLASHAGPEWWDWQLLGRRALEAAREYGVVVEEGRVEGGGG